MSEKDILANWNDFRKINADKISHNNKFSEWEKKYPRFICSKCGTENTKKEGERLGKCKCENDTWIRREKA